MTSDSFRHKRLKLETYFQDRSKIIWFLSYNILFIVIVLIVVILIRETTEVQKKYNETGRR